MTMTARIREALPADRHAIEDVVIAAFGDAEGAEITDLVHRLVDDPTAQPVLSLVAESGGKVVGQILFSHVEIEGAPQTSRAAILAPLSVHPDAQRQGIGGQLIHAGLERLRSARVALVFVLGHPSYYPRHGFVPAGSQALQAPYPIAPRNADAWMVQALREDILGRVAGRVRCAEALDQPRYWVE